jgi:ElaB/YqjD/DUF883 family membrane-anchored ribosome-binding protein
MAKTSINATNALTLVGDLFSIAGALLKSRKDSGVEKLHTLSAATRDYASNLTDLPQLKAKVGAASDSIEEVADYAIHTDVEHMFTDVAAIARKHPVATIGVTLAAGLFAALLLRSTPEPAPKTTPPKKSAKKKIIAVSRAKANGKAKGGFAAKHV